MESRFIERVCSGTCGMDEVAVDSCDIFVSVTADWLYGQGLNACTSRMIKLITRVPIK